MKSPRRPLIAAGGAVLSTFLLMAGAPSHADPPKMMAIITNARNESYAPVVTAISSAAQGKIQSELHAIDPSDVADPIRKGRLLSRIHQANLIVSVGEEATEFILREMEDVPVYFVGAGHIDGKYLASNDIAGILPYNIQDLMDSVAELKPKVFGIAYAPGYEFLADRVRAEASQRRIKVVEELVTGFPGAAAAVRSLTGKTDLIWFMGDPLLTRGPGFDFLIQRSLSRRVPVFGTDLWEVRHGALLCVRSAPDDLAHMAATSVAQIINGGLAFPKPRIVFGPAGGTVFVNSSLAKQWNLKIPRKARWKQIP